MRSTPAITVAAALTGAILTIGSANPAAADPKPINDSTQTSACDNGETYTSPVIHHAADPAAAQDHASLLVPGSNVVLHPITATGTVSFEENGVTSRGGQGDARRGTIRCAALRVMPVTEWSLTRRVNAGVTLRGASSGWPIHSLRLRN